ncbi:hypothetical protein BUALT_Bualt15G0024100 [Buddleja alternifolia]|uniref:Uncharacterized protein n=1 Tax=Buddleja alternifolia TaxID=168488 RepID=A0AAV6WMM2_9LAMI|nr:hypothetical protein BUALT_Bualt15G0024100 [Buddleja alternifolia]
MPNHGEEAYVGDVYNLFYDNRERLVDATLLREYLRYLSRHLRILRMMFKPAAYFLTIKFEVRLRSLSEVCAQDGDIHQNRITRLLRLPQTSDQGASVLLKLVTGKLGISSSVDATMKEWLEATLPYISIYDNELVTDIMDPSLIVDEDLLEEVWAMAIVFKKFFARFDLDGEDKKK